MSHAQPTTPVLDDADPPRPGQDDSGVGDGGASGPRRARRRARRLNWLGLVVGTLAFGASLTPSLLPRPWLFEGVIAGLGAALGYGLGCLLSWVIRAVVRREPSPRVKRVAWRGAAVVLPLLGLYWLLLGVGWQNEVRELVGMEDEGLTTAVVVGAVAAITAILALLVARAVRLVTAWLLRLLDVLLPRWVATVLAVAVVVLVAYVAITGVLFSGFVALMNSIYSGTNASTAPGIVAPTSSQRSGSSSSLVPWQTLGVEGRNFVARGPSVAALTAFSGRPAQEPIRVYVGLDSAPTARDRAALAVKELQRTGAFDRATLVVAGTTGTGWLEPQSVDSIEYEWNGDSAIVGIQYSYLPSWISTLVDVDKASEAGTELYNAVYAAWIRLPADRRPKLVAYGLSLGSFSMQSSFATARDLSARTQAAVFVGSPNFSQPWGQISADRQTNSPQWKPVYRNGIDIRFAGTAADLASPSGPWTQPRATYLQHANDPVVWWSPALIAQEPDWLLEPPGPGRTPTMRWYPVLTFLQVTVDQFVGVDVPQGQGHNYGTTMPAVLAATTQPPQWTDADTARLTTLIETLPVE